MASIFDSLQSIPVVGDTLNDVSGKSGLETAARGAKEAQAQANALAQLQWQRQMMGLQEARGQTQPYLSLYDRIYGTQMAGHQAPVMGLTPGMAGGPPGGLGLMRPDGTRNATTSDPNSNPNRAPIMRGSPPPVGAPPRNPTFAPPPPPPSGPGGVFEGVMMSRAKQPDPLQQYLMSMGAIR